MTGQQLGPVRADGRVQPPSPRGDHDERQCPRHTAAMAAGPRSARTGAVFSVAALALLAAACGGPSSAGSGGSSDAGGSAGSPSAVGYSRCMRSHGVQNYPDPDSSGQLPKGDAQQFGVSTSQYQAARQACRHLLPNSDTTFSASLTQCLMTGDCPHAVVQRALTEGLKFARCMRNHGVPNWPDPAVDSTGRPSFQVTAGGISIASTRSPRVLSKMGHCQNQPGAVLLRQE
jgi:hypothetical protein